MAASGPPFEQVKRLAGALVSRRNDERSSPVYRTSLA